MRLFLGVPLPADASGALRGHAAALIDRFPQLKWVPEANYHVTLDFLGEVPYEALPELRARVRGPLGVAPARVAAAGFGAFPPRGEPKVLFAAVQDPEGVCAALFRRLAAALEGFHSADRRPYVAHITLARAGARRAGIDLRCDGRPFRVEFDVDRYVLFESVLGRGGSTYRKVEEVRM